MSHKIDGLIRDVVLKRQRSYQIFSWNCWYFCQYGNCGERLNRTWEEEMVISRNCFYFDFLAAAIRFRASAPQSHFPGCSSITESQPAKVNMRVDSGPLHLPQNSI